LEKGKKMKMAREQHESGEACVCDDGGEEGE